MRKTALTTMLLALTIINGTVLAQKVKDVPVTSTIAYQDANFTPVTLQSDMQGPYQNGVSSVVSQIQAIGDWELDMLGSPVRRVYVTFNEAVPNTNPNNLPPPADGAYPVRFITQCGGYGYNLLNLTAVGQTATCGLIVAVNIGADRYSLRFYSSNFPGSDNVTVVCTSAASGKCKGWRMESPNGTEKLAAQVYKITTVKGKQVLTNYGKYRFSFDISMSNP